MSYASHILGEVKDESSEADHADAIQFRSPMPSEHRDMGMASVIDASGTRPTRKVQPSSCTPTRSYEDQQKNDRRDCARKVNEQVKGHSQKWKVWTEEKRRDFLIAEYKKRMDQRGRCNNMRSAKTHFPERYEEEAEIRWLCRSFQKKIDEPRPDDQDDEESPLKPTGHADTDEESSEEEDNDETGDFRTKKRKRGGKDKEADPPKRKIARADSAAASNTDSDSEDSGDDEQEESMRDSCVAASRGAAIFEEASEIDKAGAGDATACVRRWKWIGGKMMVWPPFEED